MIKAPGPQLKLTVYELFSGCDPAVIINNDCGVLFVFFVIIDPHLAPGKRGDTGVYDTNTS